jgi:hypothetical protein
MNFITGKHLSRRTFLRGTGASVALPFMDAMVPAGRAWRDPAQQFTRLICIEEDLGHAGGSAWGESQHLFGPAQLGRDFELSAENQLKPLEEYREYMTIVSNTDCRMAEPYRAEEIGGDHDRTTAVFLTQSHPKQTQGADLFLGKSLDQVHADRFGQETALPSLEVTTERQNFGGGCGYNYHCAYKTSVSWKSPNEPLPGIREPRAVFEQLFGAGDSPAQRSARLRTKQSVLDWIVTELADLKRDLGAVDRQALDQYTTHIRELERRIQLVEAQNRSGEERQMPEAPSGVPDSWTQHVELMFDLQVLALQADLTRVSSFKYGAQSNGTFPESGVTKAWHSASHHGNVPTAILEFNTINTYRVGRMTYFLEKMKSTMEGDASLLDKSVIMWGSAMGDPNLHNHRRCPLLLLGKGNGVLTGNLHLRAPDGTPMANAFVSLMQSLGHDDFVRFGDSTGDFPLTFPKTSVSEGAL